MLVDHRDDDLDQLERNPRFNARLTQGTVKGYRKVMQWVRDAHDERDLRQYKSLHFEKLKGDRSHQHSMAVTDQYRLIVELVDMPKGRTVVIVEITDYH